MFPTFTAASLFTALLFFHLLRDSGISAPSKKPPFGNPVLGNTTALTGNERINKSNVMATQAWD
jgi:hypothetical protein